MRFSATAAATALLAGFAVAEPLTVVTPCPGQNSTIVQPITVTKQYQAVSTCATTTACLRGSCVTKYPFETFAYVSTVIPAAWNGKQLETTTVTSTTQTVTVSRFQSTITKWVTPTAVVTKSGTTSVASPTPIYLTIAKDFAAPYNKIGPLAIPGYGGSGLCKECETQPDGSRSQVVEVVECRAGPGGSKCMGYEETWISKSAPSTSATTAQACATRFVAPSAGTYTFTFPFVAPARTITAQATTITVGPVPYWVHVTRACHRAHEVIDFTTTITKTIYWTAPCSRQAPRTSSAVALPTGKHAFPGWPQPHHGGKDSNGIDESHGDPFGWADWGSDDATDPNRPIPNEWADWVVTATVTNTVTNTATVSPIMPTPTSSSSFGAGPIDQSTTTSSMSTFTSSSSFGAGPIDQSTTSSSMSTTTSSSSFGIGPIDQSTTTSSMSTFTSSSSFSDGPIDQSTTTSSSSFGIGPIDQSTTTSSFTSTSSVATTTSTDTTSSATTTTSSSSFSSVGPIENTSSTASTTSADSTTTSMDSTTTSVDSSTSLSTTSMDTTTSTVTTFTSTTSASTTSFLTTTTSFVAIPVDANNFVIGVGAAAKYRKRALNYIKFDGDDAVLTPNKDEAALFNLDSGYLKSGGMFVDADTTQPYITFSLTVSVNVNTSKWTLSADGTISLVAFNIGICVAADGNIFIQFTQNTPFACVEIVLVAEVPGAVTSSTTSFASSTTISVPTTTTTTLDPSADMDADVPAPTNVRRGVQYGGRRFGHRRH